MPPAGQTVEEKFEDFNLRVLSEELFLINSLGPSPQRYVVTAQIVRRQAMSARQMAPAWPPHTTLRGRSNTYASVLTGTTWSLQDNPSTV